MRHLFVVIVGLMLGAAAAGAVLYFNPLSEQSAAQPQATDRVLHYSLPDQVLEFAVGEDASGLISVSYIGPPPIGAIGGEPLNERWDVDDQSDAAVTQDRGAGEPRNVADQVAQRLDDHFLLAEQPIHGQADLTLANLDGNDQDVAGVRGNLGIAVEQVGTPNDR